MQYFVFLPYAEVYWHITAILRALFCYPYYILRPMILYNMLRKQTSITLPTYIRKKRSFLGNMFYKGIIGACFGFLFWLPFWWFMLATLLSPIFYGILCGILLCFVLYCCILFMFLHVETQGQETMPTKLFCNIPLYTSKAYFEYNLLSYFIFFIILCIAIFSYLHNNSYIGVSLLYPFSITIFLFMPRTYRFWFGFFVGIFGFYWMTLSFRFQDLGMVIPFGILAVGIIYGILLWVLCYFQNLIWRLFVLVLLFVIHPLDFNWLNLAYLSAYSVFAASLLSMLCIGFACCFIITKHIVRLFVPCLFLLAFDYNTTIQIPQLHAKIIETQYPQDIRWLPENQTKIIHNNLQAINQAIQDGYPLVILPETSFPLLLNTENTLYQTLLALSHKITIVAGAMRLQQATLYPQNIMQLSPITLDTLTHNATTHSPESSYINTPNMQIGYYNTIYIFAKGHSLIADKNALVPFGETLPFNAFLSPIFEQFFGEKFGFNQGNGIVTFVTQGFHIAIANCYEGTMALPYKTGAKYVLMLSNNAWFEPSTQHFMQQMIAKYYARSYQAFVYHATNYTPKAIITPNNGSDEYIP